MAEFVIEAEPRQETGKGPNRRLRRRGRVPGVVYGAGKDPVALSLDPGQVVRVIRSHGGINTIFELKVSGETSSESVMIKDYQIEPVEHELLHTDLVRVSMDQELTLDVAVELTGIAAGVKTGGGMLDFISRTVSISCLPADIPETLVAAVDELEIGDYIRAGMLELPERVTLITEPEVVIAHVIPPRAETEETPEAEEGEAAAGLAEGEGEAAADQEEEKKSGGD